MKSLLAALLLAPTIAFAQPVQQSGNVTPGHIPAWLTTGIIGDGGTPQQGNITGIGVTANGPGICQNSGPVTGPYNEICLLANAGTGGAGLSITNNGGATGGFVLSLNGVTQGFSTVSLPTVANNTACFTNTTGTLADCAGGTVTGPGVSTNNAIAVWNGTAGLALANSLITITGSNLATPTINGNVITTGTGTLTLGAGKTFTASNTLTLTGTDSTSFGFPSSSDTVVTLGATQTLTAKTLTSPAINGATIATSTINGNTVTTGSGTLTLGAGKTLTVSNSLTLAGTDSTTMTFPSSSDTVVTLGATQTLAAKTLTAPVINNSTGISLGSNGGAAGSLTLYGTGSGSAVINVSPGAGNVNFQLPTTNGLSGQLIQTDGAGNLSYVTATGTGTITTLTAGSYLAFSSGATCTTACTVSVPMMAAPIYSGFGGV